MKIILKLNNIKFDISNSNKKVIKELYQIAELKGYNITVEYKHIKKGNN